MVRWIVLAMGVVGCTPDDAAPGAASDDVTARADRTAYYTVVQDMRRCPSPLCGGWWITPVNRRAIPCADGTVAATCYVADLDTDGLFPTVGAEEAFERSLYAGTALVAGQQHLEDIAGHDVGVLTVDEAWTGVTGTAPTGRFVRLTDSGMLCLAAPCANIDEEPLNRRSHQRIAEVDFAPSGATQDQIDKAVAAIATPDGLIVAGDRYRVSGPAGTAPGRTATEFWQLLAAR